MEKTDRISILDLGSPRSTTGLNVTLALCKSIEIFLEVHSLDCTPFWHGYGYNCQDVELIDEKWYLPVTDLHGTYAAIAFYVANGSGFMLIGNGFVHKYNQLEMENRLTILADLYRIPLKKNLFYRLTLKRPICMTHWQSYLSTCCSMRNVLLQAFPFTKPCYLSIAISSGQINN